METFLSKVSQPSPNTDVRGQLIDEWVTRFAVDCSEPADPTRIALWEDAFRDVPLEQLQAAFKKTLEAHHFQGFPKVSDIRKHIDEARLAGWQLIAAQKWEEVVSASNSDHGLGDFDAVTQCAARAAGNLSRMDYNQLEWAKKRFIDRWIVIHETGQDENLLSGDAKKLLHQLTAESKQPAPKELTVAVTPAAPPSAEDRAAFRQKFEELKDRIAIKAAEVSAPIPALTDAQFEARKELLRRQAPDIPPAQKRSTAGNRTSKRRSSRSTLLSFSSETPNGPSVDISLCADVDGVSLQCRRCGYEDLITAAEPGLDRRSLARQAAFDHCWSQHRVGAWLVRFQDVRSQ